MKVKDLSKSCPVCNNKTLTISGSSRNSKDQSNLHLLIYYCEKCNSYIREISEERILAILGEAEYTKIQNEELQFYSRINFFAYLFSLASKFSKSPNNWLDYGCSYGHFMTYLSKKGLLCTGIEISDKVRNYALSLGLDVKKQLSDLAESQLFDIVSIIDTLYYLRNPHTLLEEIHHRLRDNGIIILRVQNRNWLMKVDNFISNGRIFNSLGDMVISYSEKSLKLLLKANGFKILKFSVREKGKQRNTSIACFYFITQVIYHLTFGLINLVPGFIVIARKDGCP
ncbi:MAG: class I SAM-dependent methyltransferase [Prolixibacteraceae bacterium]|jgi:2-polyprenyl-3-methyl-5-hydroxy-6-metoxy-1,4-benzoquinol methylase|nr:class I SAM-dependent methyltransferase [Prolixibacteraceae bacterium]